MSEATLLMQTLQDKQLLEDASYFAEDNSRENKDDYDRRYEEARQDYEDRDLER